MRIKRKTTRKNPQRGVYFANFNLKIATSYCDLTTTVFTKLTGRMQLTKIYNGEVTIMDLRINLRKFNLAWSTEEN